jgi:hypothetical protein
VRELRNSRCYVFSRSPPISCHALSQGLGSMHPGNAGAQVQTTKLEVGGISAHVLYLADDLIRQFIKLHERRSFADLDAGQRRSRPRQ